MSEIILQLDDSVSFEHVIKLLAPYIKNAKIKPAGSRTKYKIWDGNAVCLQNPWKIDSFTPLKREDLYDR
jgi:hypothetical protein